MTVLLRRALSTALVFAIFAAPAVAQEPPAGGNTSERLGQTTTELADGRVLVAGGDMGGSAEIFDPSTQISTPLDGRMTAARSYHSAIRLGDGNVLMVGGYASPGGAVEGSSELFEVQSLQFVKVPGPARAARLQPAMTLLPDGRVRIVGGDAANSSELYDPATQSFGIDPFVTSVTTDRSDYSPGEIVTFTGTGWSPGEVVTLRLHEDPPIHADLVLIAAADAEGAFVNTEFAPEPHHLDMRFVVTATGADSHRTATTEFTDSAPFASTYAVVVSRDVVLPGGADIGLHCDDCAAEIRFPFTVTVYDRTFNTASVSSNGNIQFTNPGTMGSLAFRNQVLPTSAFAAVTLAPYWDDLHTGNVAGAGIFTQTTGLAPNRIFHVRWKAGYADRFLCGSVELFCSSVEFELRLYESLAQIDFVYGSMAPGSGATIGVQKTATGPFTEIAFGVASVDPDTKYMLRGVLTLPTTAAITSSANPTVFSQPVTFTATVTFSDGVAVTTGFVTFRDASTIIGVMPVDAAGRAVLTTVNLPAGRRSITATYNGSGAFTPSPPSPILTQIVNPAPTSTTVVSSPNPTFAGTPVTYTATVTAGVSPVVGSVRFFAGPAQLWVPLSVNAAGQATLTTAALSPGTHTITATFTGPNFATSSSTTTLVINVPTPTTLAVTPSEATIAEGGAAAFLAIATYSDRSARRWSGVDIWSTLPPLEPARAYTGAQALSVGGPAQLYVIGGETNEGVVATVQAFNVQMGIWTTRRPMNFARRQMGTAQLNGILYAIGGSAGSGVVRINEAYNPGTDAWTRLADMPLARETRAAAINALVYVIGGKDSSGNCSDVVQAYNPALSMWTTGFARMPTPRCDHALIALGGEIYAIGGSNADGTIYYDTVDAYNPTTDTWRSDVPPISVGRAGMAAGILDGEIYIAGGFTGSKRTGITESFDPISETWTIRSPMTPRDGMEGRFIGGRFFVPGGVGADGTITGTFEDLRPQQFNWSTDDAGIAMVEPTGVATGLSAGDAQITATGRGLTGSATLHVQNVAPSVGAGLDTTLDEGGRLIRQGWFTDPGRNTWTAFVDYGDGSDLQAVLLNPDGTFLLEHSYPDDGVYTVEVTVRDSHGGDGTARFAIAVANVLPAFRDLEVWPAAVLERGSVSVTGTFADPGPRDPHVVMVNWRDGPPQLVSAVPTAPGVFAFSAIHQYLDDDPSGTVEDLHQIVVTIADDDGASSLARDVSVSNLAPAIITVTGPSGPVLLAEAASVTVAFADPGALDTHSCRFAWGEEDADTIVDASAEGTGSCLASHTYSSTGVYSVTVTVTDDDGGASTATLNYIVVYSPEFGFITGGGWIDSPQGALSANPPAAGHANFGFNARYRGDAADGQTQFTFQDGRFKFRSTSYSWLIVAGNAATYAGSGSINGEGDYAFLVSVMDGRGSATGVDRFRIKIWDTVTGAVLYDDQPGASDHALATTPLQGGSIVIHH
jgi:PKD repeat protein